MDSSIFYNLAKKWWSIKLNKKITSKWDGFGSIVTWTVSSLYVKSTDEATMI